MFPAVDNQQAGAAASSSLTSPGLSEVNTSAAQPGPLRKQQCLPPSQHSILEYGSSPDDLAELRRAMGHMVKELMRLKDRTAASDDGFEMLTQLLARAKQLQQIPGRIGLFSHLRSASFTSCTVADVWADSLTEVSAVTTRQSQPSLAELLSPQSKPSSAHEGH